MKIVGTVLIIAGVIAVLVPLCVPTFVRSLVPVVN
jgi:hypothetical protein